MRRFQNSRSLKTVRTLFLVSPVTARSSDTDAVPPKHSSADATMSLSGEPKTLLSPDLAPPTWASVEARAGTLNRTPPRLRDRGRGGAPSKRPRILD